MVIEYSMQVMAISFPVVVEVIVVCQSYQMS